MLALLIHQPCQFRTPQNAPPWERTHLACSPYSSTTLPVPHTPEYTPLGAHASCVLALLIHQPCRLRGPQDHGHQISKNLVAETFRPAARVCYHLDRASVPREKLALSRFECGHDPMSYLVIPLRLLMSMVFGSLVGIERQWHHKNAGLKTNTLVAIGSTAFALMSAAGFGPNNNPAQVAAGVVTGIGFIGAGVIMRRGGSVQGINTAATIWATASIGVAIGIGYYGLSCCILVAVLAIQILLKPAAVFIDRRSGLITPFLTYTVEVAFAEPSTESIRGIWSAFAGRDGVLVMKYKELETEPGHLALEAEFKLSDERSREMPGLGQELARVAGVTRAEWSKAESPDND